MADNLRKNQSGCTDLTAYEAITHVDKELERLHNLLHTIFYICELAGVHVEGRIVLRDKETGKIYK